MTEGAPAGQDLSIQLLGRLDVRRSGQSATLPASKKSRALLAYLVASSRPHLRERLCELLWEAPDDPRASLRWSLAKLRPLVDAGKIVRLVGDRDELSFDAKGASVDLVELRTELGAGPEVASIESLRRAAALFRGEFLEGLDLTSCYRYTWWIANARGCAATAWRSRAASTDCMMRRARRWNMRASGSRSTALGERAPRVIRLTPPGAMGARAKRIALVRPLQASSRRRARARQPSAELTWRAA